MSSEEDIWQGTCVFLLKNREREMGNVAHREDHNGEGWYTRDQICELYKVSGRTVSRWIRLGKVRKKTFSSGLNVYRMANEKDRTVLLKRIEENTGNAREGLERRCLALDEEIARLKEALAMASGQLQNFKEEKARYVGLLEDGGRERRELDVKLRTLEKKAEYEEVLAKGLKEKLTAMKERRDVLLQELSGLPWYKRKRKRQIMLELASL